MAWLGFTFADIAVTVAFACWPHSALHASARGPRWRTMAELRETCSPHVTPMWSCPVLPAKLTWLVGSVPWRGAHSSLTIGSPFILVSVRRAELTEKPKTTPIFGLASPIVCHILRTPTEYSQATETRLAIRVVFAFFSRDVLGASSASFLEYGGRLTTGNLIPKETFGRDKQPRLATRESGPLQKSLKMHYITHHVTISVLTPPRHFLSGYSRPAVHSMCKAGVFLSQHAVQSQFTAHWTWLVAHPRG